jgi:hypothetical protein
MKTIIMGLLAVSLAFADSCGGNCPSGKCPSCPCGSTKKQEDITAWCSKHNWNVNCCKCIVSHESGGDSNAVNYNSNNTFDIGLWQINQVNWPSCSGGQPPCDPTKNLNCAVHLYEAAGNTFKAWSTTAKACGC